MKKSFSSTLVLAGVLALVLGWYLVWEKKLKPEREKRQSESKTLLPLDAKDLQELVIVRHRLPEPGQKITDKSTTETIRAKRVNGRWTLVEPVSDPGDDASISNLVTNLTTTKYEEILKENVEDWKPFGLEDAPYKVTAIRDANTKAEVWVGNDTPVGYSSYLRKPDNKTLYQVPRSLRTAFERKVEDLRDRKIVHWVRADVAEVHVQGPAGEVLVQRADGEDQWRLARQDVPVDSGEWNKSLNAILELRATEFAANEAKDLNKFGLARPHVRVDLKKTGSAEKLQLLVGKVKEKYFVKRGDRDTIFEVSKDGMDKLERPASALVDKTVVKFNRFQAKRVRIEHLGTIGKETKKESVELVKNGADWAYADNSPASLQKVETFLTTLQDLKLADYTAAPKGTPVMRAVVLVENTKDGKAELQEVANVSFFSSDGNTVIGTRSGLDKGFKIKVTDFKPIHLGKADFAETAKAANSGSNQETEKKPNS